MVKTILVFKADRNEVGVLIYKADISDIVSFDWKNADEPEDFGRYIGEEPIRSRGFGASRIDFTDERWLERLVEWSGLDKYDPDYRVQIGKDRAPRKLLAPPEPPTAVLVVFKNSQKIRVAKKSVYLSQQQIREFTEKLYGPVLYRTSLPSLPSHMSILINMARNGEEIATIYDYAPPEKEYVREVERRKAELTERGQAGFLLIFSSDSSTDAVYRRF